MKSKKYKQYNYAELQQILAQLEDGIGDLHPSLAEALRQAQVMLREFHNVVNRLAMYDDYHANQDFAIHGDYTAFNEPYAVQQCRELLQRL